MGGETFWMNNPTIIDTGQYARLVAELRKVTAYMDEIQQGINVAEGMSKHEAQRAFDKATHDIETAGFWISKALKHLGIKK